MKGLVIIMKGFYLILFFLFIFNISAQQLTISGLVIDNKNNPVQFANVRIETLDSVSISETTTNDKGKFYLSNIKQGNYLLQVSCLGYETYNLKINNLKENISIYAINLSNSTVSLNEVIVNANNSITKVDRQIFFPPKSFIISSASSLELLSKMMLPGLIVNTTTNSIKSLNQGVQIRINDIKATVEDLIALKVHLKSLDINLGLEFPDNFLMKVMVIIPIIQFAPMCLYLII